MPPFIVEGPGGAQIPCDKNKWNAPGEPGEGMGSDTNEDTVESTPEPRSVSPWEDDSGPNIIEIINNPKARHLLTPANLGHLLTVSAQGHFSLTDGNQFLYAACVPVFLNLSQHNLSKGIGLVFLIRNHWLLSRR